MEGESAGEHARDEHRPDEQRAVRQLAQALALTLRDAGQAGSGASNQTQLHLRNMYGLLTRAVLAPLFAAARCCAATARPIPTFAALAFPPLQQQVDDEDGH